MFLPRFLSGMQESKRRELRWVVRMGASVGSDRWKRVVRRWREREGALGIGIAQNGQSAKFNGVPRSIPSANQFAANPIDVPH